MRKVAAQAAPNGVAKVIKSGLQAIMAATTHFMASPPDILEGISQLGRDLFACIEQLLAEEHQASAEFHSFKENWEQGFDNIVGAVESVEADINKYVANGDTAALVRAIGSVISEAGHIVSTFLPPQTGVEVLKYLDAIAEAFRVMGSSWDDFENGRTVEGIEAVYLGLRGITDGLLPEELKNNEVFNAIVTTLDVILGNLTQHVLEYERHILNSNVCWRVEKYRQREWPSKCPRGYTWDGQGYCYPLSLLERRAEVAGSVASSSAGAEEGQLDAALQGKGGGGDGGGGGRVQPGHNSVPARCNPFGPFPEKHGQYCYQSCGAGFIPKEGNQKCISACAGKFPAETPAMCGRDQGIVGKAIMEMVTTVLDAAFDLTDTFMSLDAKGIDGNTIAKTIQVFIDLGKPFANPTCPAPDEIETTEVPTAAPAVLCGELCSIGDDADVCRILAGSAVICLPAGGGPGGEGCAPEQTYCPEKEEKLHHVECSLGEKVFISSHKQQQLVDTWHASLSPNKQAWEEWTLSDAGDGKVFITSHRNFQLSDNHGHIKMSPNRESYEKWTLTDAGVEGKVFITSHRGQYLQDNGGHLKLSWHAANWERFTITDQHGASAC